MSDNANERKACTATKIAARILAKGGILPKLKNGSSPAFCWVLYSLRQAFSSACCFLRIRSRSASVGNLTTFSLPFCEFLSWPFDLLID